MHKMSALFTTQRDNNRSNGGQQLMMASRHHVNSSPALIELTNSSAKSSLVPRDDGLSICAMFKLIAQKRICVVRRAGSDVDQKISSLIASAFHSVGKEPPIDGSSDVHFLTVDHHCAGKMLDRVGRQGLPLIFLNGGCLGGLAELKRLMMNGFLVESLCVHDFDLAVIGGGEGNAVAERAVKEAMKLGKRVALVENGGIRRRHSDAFMDAQIAKQIANHAALMRHSIEEAQRNGWTVECSGEGKISFGLDWQCVREAIEQKTRLKRERTEKAFERGKVKVFSATACHFSDSHQLTFCQQQQTTDSDSAQSKLAKLSADKFVLVPKNEAKVLENVPGAKEFCISNDQLFCSEHNPGTTLFFCDDEADPQVLESAAILKALGNEVTIMTNTYSPSRKVKEPFECFDSELILWIKDKLCQLGIRFFISLPTKFERLREATDGKSAILRVYATNAWSKSTEKGATGDWTPFVKEFNTVVISVGRRSHFADGLVLDNVSEFGSSKLPNSSSFSDSINCTLNGGTTTKMPSSSELLQAPNVYGIGDLRMDHRWRGEKTPRGQSEEGNCQRVQKLLRKMYESEFETMDNGDLPIVSRTIFIPPMEYACCGLNEEEAEAKWGRHLTRIYRDEKVPIVAEKAKLICVKEMHQKKKECVVGLHIIGPKASQLVSGYAMAMKLGLTKCQMKQDSWHKSANF